MKFTSIRIKTETHPYINFNCSNHHHTIKVHNENWNHPTAIFESVAACSPSYSRWWFQNLTFHWCDLTFIIIVEDHVQQPWPPNLGISFQDHFHQHNLKMLWLTPNMWTMKVTFRDSGIGKWFIHIICDAQYMEISRNKLLLQGFELATIDSDASIITVRSSALWYYYLFNCCPIQP